MTSSIFFKVLRIVGAVYLFINLWAWLVAEKLIFNPQPDRYTDHPDMFKITTPNGEKLTALFLENPAAEYTLLFSHGNAEDLSTIVPFLSQFPELGYSILMYDYRGYGTSEGKPSVKNTYEDVEACYRWLTEEKGIAPEKVIAHGRSVGGGPATWLAAHYPVGGLIVESSFVSAIRVKTIVPILPWDKYPNLKHIKRIKCPCLIMHGVEDEVLPFWHGKKLYAAAPEPKMNLWIKDAQHNDYAYVADTEYFKTFLGFIDLIQHTTE